MSTFKIEFNSLLFKQLVQMVYLGRWMVASHQDDSDQSGNEIEQFVYAHAKTSGFDDLVDFDANSSRYLPSEQLEEEMEPIIQNYDDITFWDQLAWQLAERDFEKRYDQAQILCMTEDEIFREKNIIADRYFDEFSVNGLENLKLLKS
jgi:hypothetical protein